MDIDQQNHPVLKYQNDQENTIYKTMCEIFLQDQSIPAQLAADLLSLLQLLLLDLRR